MRLITAADGRLLTLGGDNDPSSAPAEGFVTGLRGWDGLSPHGRWARGAVHELLSPGAAAPLSAALILARAAARVDSAQDQPSKTRPIVWCEPADTPTLYPPAVAAAGIDLSSFYLLRPASQNELLWSMAECLRCPAVGAVVAPAGNLSRLAARRLQLAAEAGNSVAILLRLCPPAAAIGQKRRADVYAAATRWRVEPAAGEPTVQRWKIQLLHGHGGRVGDFFHLECCRETHLVRAADAVADRSIPPVASNAPRQVG